MKRYALKAEIAGLRENLKDVLRILGFVYGIPFVQPGMRLFESKRLVTTLPWIGGGSSIFELPEEPENRILVESFW